MRYMTYMGEEKVSFFNDALVYPARLFRKFKQMDKERYANDDRNIHR